MARRRLPAPWLIGGLVVVALLPGALFTWADLVMYRLAEPVWPIWRSLAPVLVPLVFIQLLVGSMVNARRRPTEARACRSTKIV